MVINNFQEPQPSQNFSVERKPNILVVDDHPTILNGTINLIYSEHPEASIVKAQTAQEMLSLIQSHQFDLVVMDLSIPDRTGESAKIELGIQLLQNLLKEYPHQNFLVQTSYVKALIRIKHEIDNHQGGFAIADKALPENEMLMRFNLALIGATHTKDIK
ncbi:MAG: response regulator transcription factor, partial [Cyanobacteria bacterium P01_D01_bin.116]